MCSKSRLKTSSEPDHDMESIWASTPISISTPAARDTATSWQDAAELAQPFPAQRQVLLDAITQFIPLDGKLDFSDNDDEDGVVYEWGEDDNGNATVTTYRTEDDESSSPQTPSTLAESVPIIDEPMPSLPASGRRARGPVIAKSASRAEIELDAADNIHTLEGNALSALNARFTAKSIPAAPAPPTAPERVPESVAPVAKRSAKRALVVPEPVPTKVEPLPAYPEPSNAFDLSELQQPDTLPEHRTSGVAAEVRNEMALAPKFREKWQLFIRQLSSWKYLDKSDASAKQGIMAFARANPDLLYHLPAREVHIFVKKFAAFAPRSMERKVRAGTARLSNLYVAFEPVPTFNGQPNFKDLLRLLLFVSLSDFQALESRAPGIVGAANVLLPLVLDAAVQPLLPNARRDHAADLQILVEATADAASRQTVRKQLHSKPYAPH